MLENFTVFDFFDRIKRMLKFLGRYKMATLKKEALNAISKLPNSAKIDDIMYRLYVIDKIKKGQEAIQNGKTISVEELKKEMKSW